MEAFCIIYRDRPYCHLIALSILLSDEHVYLYYNYTLKNYSPQYTNSFIPPFRFFVIISERKKNERKNLIRGGINNDRNNKKNRTYDTFELCIKPGWRSTCNPYLPWSNPYGSILCTIYLVPCSIRNFCHFHFHVSKKERTK